MTTQADATTIQSVLNRYLVAWDKAHQKGSPLILPWDLAQEVSAELRRQVARITELEAERDGAVARVQKLEAFIAGPQIKNNTEWRQV